MDGYFHHFNKLQQEAQTSLLSCYLWNPQWVKNDGKWEWYINSIIQNYCNWKFSKLSTYVQENQWVQKCGRWQLPQFMANVYLFPFMPTQWHCLITFSRQLFTSSSPCPRNNLSIVTMCNPSIMHQPFKPMARFNVCSLRHLVTLEIVGQLGNNL